MVVFLKELVFALGCFVGDDFSVYAEFSSTLLLCEIVESVNLSFFLLISRDNTECVEETLGLGTT